MEGDDISTRITREGFPKTISTAVPSVNGTVPGVVCDGDPQGCYSVQCQLGKRCKHAPKPSPLDRVDWDVVTGKPRQSWWARVRAWWAR